MLVGAILTHLKNVKSPIGAAQRWTKFLFYLLFISLMFGMTYLNQVGKLWTFGILALVGTIEFISVARGTSTWRIISILFYVVLMLGFLNSATLDSFWIRETMFVVFIFDSFSQLIGQLLGKTSLAAKVSPNKTVEGAIGGWLVASTMVWLSIQFEILPGITHGLPVLLWVFITCILALAGDLLASVVKRRVGVKDYGAWIPENGGINDRADSLFFALAVFGLSIFIS